MLLIIKNISFLFKAYQLSDSDLNKQLQML
jgi:hypothetical protein